MAKVSRKMLKSIVKECLVELLAEGLTNGNTNKLSESILNKSNNIIKEENTQDVIVNHKFEESTNKIITQTTKDPIMASILQDTARTTLQEQNSLDQPNKFSSKSNDIYSQTVNENDPMDIFSESSGNWATLAFSDK